MDVLIWEGAQGAGMGDTQPQKALLGRRVGQRPEENARVGGWDCRQPWPPARSGRECSTGKEWSVCVCVP